MDEAAFKKKLLTRTSSANADSICTALVRAGLLDKISFLKDGRTTSVFAIEDSGMVLKIFDRRMRQNERIYTSRYHLHDYYRMILSDESQKNSEREAAEVVIEIEPRLTDQGLTSLHQEMLRYKLWTQEGTEFWDILPPASNRLEIKNVMLDYRGVPYQIDEDAARKFEDGYNEYPADNNGRRGDEQYLAWRADSMDQHGKSDALSQARFKEIKDACEKAHWPERQASIFANRVSLVLLQQFAAAFDSMKQELAQGQRATITNPYARTDGIGRS